MLEKVDARTVIDDTRARAAAVLQLIYFTDTQATALLRIYVLIGVAAASGGAAGLSGATAIPRALGAAFAAAAVMAAIGAYLCLRAMVPATISFPGREPSFWNWAIDEPSMNDEQVLRAYLVRAQEKLTLNYDVNEAGARALSHAKWFAIAMPIAPLLAAIGALILKF